MPELDLDSLEDAARTERQQQGASREVLPLEYSPKDARGQPPFDWPNTLRQFFFALGVSFVVGGTIAWQGSYAVWRDNEVIWIAFGAFFITLTIPWPGRIGWKRS